MNNDVYISPQKITKQFDITSNTLRRWAEKGDIRYIRPNNGRRVYHIEDVKQIFGINIEQQKKQIICYARVSSNHQKEDLERQVQFLKEKFPDSKIIKDIGSGLNWKRQGFQSLLELVYLGKVEQVIIAYKDRLCRFGFELMEWIFEKHGVKLKILSKVNEEKSSVQELSEDLLSIVTVFVAKNNGIRAVENRKQRKKL
jgi:putative resolvase